MNTSKECFAQIHKQLESYYLRWYHEKPMIITSKRQEELSRLHALLHKSILYLGAHYLEYVPDYMPLSDREMKLLEMQSAYPYRAGTYRPDYLIDTANQIKLCEITSRFFAHGIFMSYFAECVSDQYAKNHGERNSGSHMTEMFDYMLSITEGKSKISVLKSSDRTSEIKLYEPFYRHYGKQVQIFEADQVESNLPLWKDSFLISALNQKDLLSFSPDTILCMLDAGMYNDLRTVLLAHDKRFFHLLFCDCFTDAFLSKEETAFLRAHTIPTWLPGTSQEIWQDAYLHKDRYILKHYRLGKSEKVYAGVLTSEEAWKALWQSSIQKDLILQPFLSQKTYPVVWEGQSFQDYICGMMLCVNDRYFGSGLFRASSLPVTNIGDDRKIAMLETDYPSLIQDGDVL